jgi:chromate transporter
MKEIFFYFFKLGCLGFGGPLALIAQMQKELVQDKKWLTDEQFNRVFALIKAMPGPVAFQTVVYLSHNRRGFWGGLVGGVALITPAAILMIFLATYYDAITASLWMRPLLEGMQAGAFALIVLAIYMLANTFLKSVKFWLFIIFGIFLIARFSVPEPLLIIGFGLIALIRKKVLVSVDPVVLGSLAWVSFKAGAFIFGTGLAIIPILQRDFVDQLGWLTRSQFLDAVSFGQLTPGPVSVTVTFIGFKVAGFLGALIATVGIFLPAFIHMVTWFPRIVGWLSRQKWINDFTLGVTAAVVGSIILAIFPLAEAFNSRQFTICGVLIVAAFSTKIPGWALVIAGGLINFVLVQTA